MTRDAILAEVAGVIRRTLDNELLEIVATTTAADVPGWDSISNVPLIVAVERQFKLRFTSAQLRSFRNVGDMCAAIELKQRPG